MQHTKPPLIADTGAVNGPPDPPRNSSRSSRFDERSQRLMLWWFVGLALTYGSAVVIFVQWFPVPDTTRSSTEIAQWYIDHSVRIRVGAAISSWTGGFIVPLSIVIAVQIARLGIGRVWTYAALMGGGLMSVWLALPPVIWGVAAFAPNRSPEIIATLHDLGHLMFWTTDQYYIFLWIAVAVVCLKSSGGKTSPFPRWFGFFSLWMATMFESGGFAWLFHSGPASYQGVLVSWIPMLGGGLWFGTLVWLMFRALRAQEEERLRYDASLT